MPAEIKMIKHTTGSIANDASSFIEEWYITAENFLECEDLLRPYRNTAHSINSAYRVADISYSQEGATGGIVQVIATVTYKRGGSTSSQNTSSAPVFSFSAGGGTKHITTAPLVKSQGSKETDHIPDPKELVGWNGDSGRQGFHVAGVDVPTAQIKETWEKEIKMGSLTTTWRRKIASMIGTCNNSTFKGWESGEVLFVDCSFSGSQDSSEKIKVRFDFAIRPNETNAVVGGVNLGKVEGWQYTWVIPLPHAEGYAPVIAGAYVSQVVSYSDFSQLGL